MAILVNDTTPRNQYTATSGQTVFAYSFEIFDVTDVKVYNGSTLLTYASGPSGGTQYSVSNAGVTGGGNITLGSGGASNGDTITIEPWRAKSFPVIKDLVVDRSSFDRIIQAGGFISVNTGSAPDGNSIPIGKDIAEDAFDAAACIGCGACVAACKNASASLFVAAKVSQLALLPQGQPEREERVVQMVSQMDDEGFGHCTNTGACEAECPKEISVDYIRKMNWEYHRSNIKG